MRRDNWEKGKDEVSKKAYTHFLYLPSLVCSDCAIALAYAAVSGYSL
ncbi:hypothetical protein H6F70_12370 [Coleofasciculus sp. FACHB-T130]|nr:hypothetical protein [Coleofasciculus sp. FACHB-T130]MBD2084528.1 hypothetical protein [Coleofasciculus sp. FACHB-542]